MSCPCGEPHPVIRHGTRAGYQMHAKLVREGHAGVEPCELCLAAAAAYRRSWRVHSHDKQRRIEDRQLCRKRALIRLGRLHAEELSLLYAAELESAGLA